MNTIPHKLAQDLQHFIDLWHTNHNNTRSIPHSPELWNERANEWLQQMGKDRLGKFAEDRRVAETAKYLRFMGLLSADDLVVDIGSGPGLFALEFAKTCKHAVGIDYASNFTHYAQQLSRNLGVHNTEFITADFQAMDMSKHRHKYDLAFSSMSPAVNRHDRIAKFQELSHAWCCNVSTVGMHDTLAEQMCRDVFAKEYVPPRTGNGFYALANIIWLHGYLPETHTYQEHRSRLIDPTPEAAREYAEFCGCTGEGDEAKILRYLEHIGSTVSISTNQYGYVLWDKRQKRHS